MAVPEPTAPRDVPPPPDPRPVTGESVSIGEVIDDVVAYAKQETLGPLRHAGRWLGFGAAGALLLGIGGVVVLLGLLRLLQTEWTRSATGSLSWLSYLIVVVVGGALVALAISRIRKTSFYPNDGTDAKESN